MRALIWGIIIIVVAAYFFFSNIDRLPEYGHDLADMWPFISIVVGMLILFRRKGRPKHDFFFNNTKLEKQLEEYTRQNQKQSAEK
jgi:hypothetical protein